MVLHSHGDVPYVFLVTASLVVHELPMKMSNTIRSFFPLEKKVRQSERRKSPTYFLKGHILHSVKFGSVLECEGIFLWIWLWEGLIESGRTEISGDAAQISRS